MTDAAMEANVFALLSVIADPEKAKKALTALQQARVASEKAHADSEAASRKASEDRLAAESIIGQSEGTLAAHNAKVTSDLAELKAQRDQISLMTQDLLGREEKLKAAEASLAPRQKELENREKVLVGLQKQIEENHKTSARIKSDLQRRLDIIQTAQA